VIEDSGLDGVDMNFGCPVKKVTKCNGGSGLLRDLPLIREILEAVRAAVSIPFTCKFRTGWNDSEIVCCEVGKIAEDVGLAELLPVIVFNRGEVAETAGELDRACRHYAEATPMFIDMGSEHAAVGLEKLRTRDCPGQLATD